MTFRAALLAIVALTAAPALAKPPSIQVAITVDDLRSVVPGVLDVGEDDAASAPDGAAGSA